MADELNSTEDKQKIYPSDTELRIYPSFAEVREQFDAPQVRSFDRRQSNPILLCLQDFQNVLSPWSFRPNSVRQFVGRRNSVAQTKLASKSAPSRQWNRFRSSTTRRTDSVSTRSSQRSLAQRFENWTILLRQPRTNRIYQHAQRTRNWSDFLSRPTGPIDRLLSYSRWCSFMSAAFAILSHWLYRLRNRLVSALQSQNRTRETTSVRSLGWHSQPNETRLQNHKNRIVRWRRASRTSVFESPSTRQLSTIGQRPWPDRHRPNIIEGSISVSARSCRRIYLFHRTNIHSRSTIDLFVVVRPSRCENREIFLSRHSVSDVE